MRNLRVPRATPKHKKNVDLRKRSPLVEASGEASCLVHLRCCLHNVGVYSEIVTLLPQMVFLLVISSSKIHPISNHQICSPKTQFSPLHCLDETPVAFRLAFVLHKTNLSSGLTIPLNAALSLVLRLGIAASCGLNPVPLKFMC